MIIRYFTKFVNSNPGTKASRLSVLPAVPDGRIYLNGESSHHPRVEWPMLAQVNMSFVGGTMNDFPECDDGSQSCGILPSMRKKCMGIGVKGLPLTRSGLVTNDLEMTWSWLQR
jgi:hypothetical protein